MLNKKEIVNTKKYKDIFVHKLKNLSKKSPVLLNFICYDNHVVIHELFTDKEKKFMYEFNKDVKHTIYNIVEWLKSECYPVMIEIKKESKELTREEVDKYINLGMHKQLDERILRGNTIDRKIGHRIDKLIIGTYRDGTPRDEIMVTNLEVGKTFQYRLSIPATIFLKQVRDRLSPEEAFKKFSEVSTFLKEC